MTVAYHHRNLPHYFVNNGTYFITFRLANSIPQDKLEQLKNKNKNPGDKIFAKYDALLESQEYGEKFLSDEKVAENLVRILHSLDDEEYKIICYTIMSNHVHLLFETQNNVSRIMKTIKGRSARESNLLLNRTGSFWQSESFDRVIRDERELNMVIKYVLLNPVKCGLVNKWSDWKYTYCSIECNAGFEL